MKINILGDHIVYGHLTPMIVHYHPNGIHCSIFLISGFQQYYYGNVKCDDFPELEQADEATNEIGFILDFIQKLQNKGYNRVSISGEL